MRVLVPSALVFLTSLVASASSASLMFSSPDPAASVHHTLPSFHQDVDTATFGDLFGEELASFLQPGGLRNYVEKRMDDVYRTVARETMGYEVRRGHRGRGELPSAARLTLHSTKLSTKFKIFRKKKKKLF
jgi:hypothetical protein